MLFVTVVPPHEAVLISHTSHFSALEEYNRLKASLNRLGSLNLKDPYDIELEKDESSNSPLISHNVTC